jgi:hypothetical protein
MIVLPVGTYSPVAPVAPVTPVVRKTKSAEKKDGKAAATEAARPADAMASHNARAALDDLKLGG